MVDFKKHLQNEEVRKLKDSFASLANEYRVSENWRDHFWILFENVNVRINELKEHIALHAELD